MHIFNDNNPKVRFQGRETQYLPELPYLIDFYHGPVRADDVQIGVIAGMEFPTGSAPAANIVAIWRLAVDKGGKGQCRSFLAHTVRTAKQIGMRDPVIGDRPIKQFFGPTLANQIIEGKKWR